MRRNVGQILPIAVLVAVAHGALAGSPWPPEDWNPQPMPDDVILPMPCDGAIAFRRIDTPAQPNWLADTVLQMGGSDASGQEHSEAPLTDAVAGGLVGSGPDSRFYLLGKYEISRRQYDAVMAPECPPGGDQSSWPAENMPWLEAQDFALRYTEWLYANAPEELEDKAGRAAFMRLPTEQEWEFAARGGLAVTDAVRRLKTFPMDGPLEEYVWFAGFKSCGDGAQPIGILNPNPLGLLDILGNVQEFTSDLYRLRTRDRWHGQTGGVVARGGSCITSEARVRSAERDEVALIDPVTGAPRGKSFTGIRLAVGAPVLTSPERINAINEDWRALAEMRIALEPGQDPIEALDLIAGAEDNPDIRAALENARDQFDREMARRNAIESRSAVSVLRSGMLAIRSYIRELEDVHRARDILQANPDDPMIAEWGRRNVERLSISENLLLDAVFHAAEEFDASTFDAAFRIVAEENQLRLAGMTDRTRVSTDQMFQMFAGFVATYRGQNDTDPQVFLDELSDYYDLLTSD